MPRNITVTLEDGSTHVYQNAPDDITPEQVMQRAMRDFGSHVTALDGGRKPESTPAQQNPVTDYLKETVNNAKEMYGLAGRAAIEGVAGIPEGIYNLGAAATGNQPIHYGKDIADKIGLPNSDSMAMDVGRAVLGGGIAGRGLKAVGYLPKIAEAFGASTPIRTAVGTGAGVVASDTAQDFVKDSDNPLVKHGVPIAAGVLGNIAGSGIGKATAYMTDSSERGADALIRQSAKSENKIPDELAVALESYNAKLYGGVQPTAAMLYKNPSIADAETIARLRNKGSFFDRDTQNTRLISDALRDRAEPTKLSSLKLARSNATKDAYETVHDTMIQSSPELERILNTNAGRDAVSGAKVFASNEYRKFGERTPTVPTDEIMNANDPSYYGRDLHNILIGLRESAKDINTKPSMRRSIGLVHDDFNNYLEQNIPGLLDVNKKYRELSKPVNDAEAWQKIYGKFENKPEIDVGVPQVTPFALRSAVNKESFDKLGNDLLLPQSREDADKMIQTMNAMERARSPRGSINGSQTTPLAMEVTKRLIPDKAKPIVSLMGGMKDFLTGNTALDDALLNPEKLPSLLELAVKNKDKKLLDTVKDSIVRQSILNQSQNSMK